MLILFFQMMLKVISGGLCSMAIGLTIGRNATTWDLNAMAPVSKRKVCFLIKM